MRICFLSRRYFPAVSGMSVYARNMTKALAQRGHDIVMISQYREDEKGVGIYGGGPPPAESWMLVEGIRSHGEERADAQTPADFESDMHKLIQTALKHHQHESFDIVHAQYCYPTGLAALALSQKLGIPSVVSIQGGDGHWVGLCCTTHRKAMDAVLNHASALIIGCESFADEVVQKHNLSKSLLTIIPGATNTDQFKPVKRPAVFTTPVRLLYHGRVDQRKGALDCVRATHLLLAQGENIQLVISGIGPDKKAAEKLVQDLKMEGNTTFLGGVPYSEAAKVYEKGDIFVSPTYAEGFSNTVLEAMACGLPIVSTNVVGVVDCLTHEVNALLTEPGDINALAGAIKKLIHNKELRDKLVETAKTEVKEKYSWPVVAEQLEAVYLKLSLQPMDHNWMDMYNMATTVDQADLSCQFRQKPHLL